MTGGIQTDRKTAQSVSWRQFAKIAVVALGVAGFAGAGLSGALAHGGDDWDDDVVFSPSGGVFASGGSGGTGWDDSWTFPNSVASGGSGGSGWDDDGWDDDGWDD